MGNTTAGQLIDQLNQHLDSEQPDGEIFLSKSVRKFLHQKRERYSSAALINALQEINESHELDSIIRRLQKSYREEALIHHQIRRANRKIPSSLCQRLGHLPLTIPLGWTDQNLILDALRSTLFTLDDRHFVREWHTVLTDIKPAVEGKVHEAIENVKKLTGTWTILSRYEILPILEDLIERSSRAQFTAVLSDLQAQIYAELDNRKEITFKNLGNPSAIPPESFGDVRLNEALAKKFQECEDPEKKIQLFDLIFSCNGETALQKMTAIVDEPWAMERATLLLTLRFGKAELENWEQWEAWISDEIHRIRDAREKLHALFRDHPIDLLFCWYSLQHSPDVETLNILNEYSLELANTIETTAFVRRWGDQLSDETWQILLGHRKRAHLIGDEPNPKKESSNPSHALPPLPHKPTSSLPPLPYKPPEEIPEPEPVEPLAMTVGKTEVPPARPADKQAQLQKKPTLKPRLLKSKTPTQKSSTWRFIFEAITAVCTVAACYFIWVYFLAYKMPQLKAANLDTLALLFIANLAGGLFFYLGQFRWNIVFFQWFGATMITTSTIMLGLLYPLPVIFFMNEPIGVFPTQVLTYFGIFTAAILLLEGLRICYKSRSK